MPTQQPSVRRVAATTAIALAGVVLIPPVAASAAPRGSTAAQTFTYTGAAQTITVPPLATGVTVSVNGASGGRNTGDDAAGGVGVRIDGAFAVGPGDTLTIGVGGQGSQNDGNRAPGAGGWGSAPQYAGGRGGGSHGEFETDGAGGGGASTVALNGTVVVVAGAGGGGGGKGGAGGDYPGGDGGGTVGGNGRRYLGKTGGLGGSAANPALDPVGGSETGADLSGGGGGGGGGRYVGEGGTKSVDGGGGGGGGSSLYGVLSSPTVAAAPAGNGSVTLTFQGPTPTVAGQPPGVYAGTPYSYSFTTTADPSVTLTQGSLPSGLTLSPTGTLSGVPTAAGSYDFTVTAQNAYGSVTLPTSILISPSLAPAIAGQPAPAQVGATYSYQFQVSGSPFPVVSSTGTLPPGLSLSLTQAGVLSGVPSQAGTYAFTVIASGGQFAPATLPVTMTVTAAAVGAGDPVVRPSAAASPPSGSGSTAAPTSRAAASVVTTRVAGRGGSLAYTGVAVAPMVVAALVLLGVGGALLVGARRRRPTG